jgi:Ni/Fe-hydrogenase subunit HybB-like protein
MTAIRSYLRQHPFLLPWTAVLLLVCGLGAVAAVLVWTRGLVLTGLNDLVPWGLWITLDLSAIGIGAGAFLLSAAIYLLKLKEYQPLARVAVLVGLLGYTAAAFSLLLDLGRPDRFWHPIVFWNTHSVLWEITMCVILYTGVLVVEFLPVIGHAAWLERRLPWLARILQWFHSLAPVLAVLGLLLSLLHHSSLGATYGVLPFRPLWGNPGTAVLFLANAVFTGPALTVLAALLAQRVLRRELVPAPTLAKVTRFVGIAAAVYLYMRVWDLFAMSYTHIPFRVEGLEYVTGGPLALNLWVGELLLGALLPALLLLVPQMRRQPWAVPVACALTVVGLVVTRWDVNLSTQLLRVGWMPGEPFGGFASYAPTWVEWAASAAIVAYWLLGFTWSLHLFPVFAGHGQEARRDIAALHAEPAVAEHRPSVETP